MPDTAHKYQNPLYGATPASLSGSESPLCHIDAYTPATAAKSLQPCNASDGLASGEEEDYDSETPLAKIVRRDMFDESPRAASGEPSTCEVHDGGNLTVHVRQQCSSCCDGEPRHSCHRVLSGWKHNEMCRSVL